MTILIGASHPDVKMAVLAADRQISSIDGHGGTVPDIRSNHRKLYVTENENHAFAHAGPVDEETEKLIYQMKTGDIDLGEIVQQGFFTELEEDTKARMGNRTPYGIPYNTFLLLSRAKSLPQVYKLWPLGKVEHRGIHVAGDEKAVRYAASAIDARDLYADMTAYKTYRDITRRDVLEAAIEPLHLTQLKTPSCSGVDVAVMTPRAVKDYGLVFGNETFRVAMQKIKRDYS